VRKEGRKEGKKEGRKKERKEEGRKAVTKLGASGGYSHVNDKLKRIVPEKGHR